LFENTRTGAKAGELRAYQSEDESSAKSRLMAAGWSFNVDYVFEDQVFRIKATPDDADEGSDDSGE
jgi:hypothetical protein